MWDWNRFKNKEDIEEAERELKSVDPSFEITSVGGGSIVYTIGTFFPVKGNASKIKTLKDLGWFVGVGSKQSGAMYTRMYKALKK